MSHKNPKKVQVNPLLKNPLNKNFQELADLRKLNCKKKYKTRKPMLKNKKK